MDVRYIILFIFGIILLYLLNKTQKLETFTTTPSPTTLISNTKYQLVDKNCWNDSLSRTISNTFLDMRNGLPQRILNADMTSNISITIPAELVNNLTIDYLPYWNILAFNIATIYGFDTIGYQSGNKMFFGKYGITFNSSIYKYDKIGPNTSSTCLPYGSDLVNHVYILELINPTTTTSSRTSTTISSSSSTLPSISSSTTTRSTMDDLINDKYKGDIDAIRNLIGISNKIYNKETDTLIIPATNTYINNLIIDEDFIIYDKDKNYLDIFPRYMVLIWGSTNEIRIDGNKKKNNIPKGWALCDGTKYYLNDDGDTQKAYEDKDGIYTPDLRGRFILGSGYGSKDEKQKHLIQRNLYEKGGEEYVKLKHQELPPHTHTYPYITYNSEKSSNITNENIYFNVDNKAQTSSVYGNNLESKYSSHNNMPPYYVLTYIMKL
jgi:microcystin-dependent protein